MSVQQVGVLFNAESETDLTQLPKAKRALMRSVRARGLKAFAAPPLDFAPANAFVDGVFRVIIAWIPFPSEGMPRWIGRLDTLAKAKETA